MDFFEQDNYKISKKFACLVGRWPNQDKLRSSVIALIILLFFIIQIIPQMLAVIVNAGNSKVVLDSIPAFLIDFISAAKYLNIICHKESVAILFQRIKNDWQILTNPVEKDILKNYADNGRLLATGYAGVVYFTTILFVMEPLVPYTEAVIFSKENLTLEKNFAVPMEYIILNKEKHYWLLISISSTCIMAIVTVLVSSDIIFIVFLQHACGLFAVVGHQMENFPSNIGNTRYKKNFTTTKAMDNQFKHAVKCIVSHERALEFAELLESTYVWGFGIVKAANLPLMSVTGMQVITPENTVEQLMKYIMLTGAQMLHLFFDCFLSQQLMDNSYKIQSHITNRKWYENSLKSQKLLVLITMRSQTPCHLTAGKFIILSMENFAKMVKISASYFTVLLSMR